MRHPDEDDLEEFGLAVEAASPVLHPQSIGIFDDWTGVGSVRTTEDQKVSELLSRQIRENSHDPPPADWADIVGESVENDLTGAAATLKQLRGALGKLASRSPAKPMRQRPLTTVVPASPLTFSSGNILPGDTATLVARPMQIFRLNSIITQESAPGNVEINSIFIGAMNLFATPTMALPCSLFTQAATPTITLPKMTAQVGVDISVTVKNTGTSPCRVTLVMQGDTIR